MRVASCACFLQGYGLTEAGPAFLTLPNLPVSNAGSWGLGCGCAACVWLLGSVVRLGCRWVARPGLVGASGAARWMGG